jgi:hypothetical protein
MTDKDLLEKAAKAMGYKYMNGALWDGRDVIEYVWHPQDDDGQALRLAVRLGVKDYFGVEVQETCVQATAFEPWEHCEYEEYKEQDPYAATRRAIVRAAAEIGGSM